MAIFLSSHFANSYSSIGHINSVVLSLQLKTECGSQFTNKLEGMFKVCNVNMDSIQEFCSIFILRILLGGRLLLDYVKMCYCDASKVAFM